jgi:hypothetical protein
MSRTRMVARAIGRRVETTSAPIAAAMNRMTKVVGRVGAMSRASATTSASRAGSRTTLIGSLRGGIPRW